MNASSRGPHDRHHAATHVADVSAKTSGPRGTTESAGQKGPGAHDRHAGHSVAMFRDRFWITLLLSIPTLLWSGMVLHMSGVSAPVFRPSRGSLGSVCVCERCGRMSARYACA